MPPTPPPTTDAGRPCRVLHVIDRLAGHGGAEVSLDAILRRSDPSRFAHAVVLLKPGSRLDALHACGVRSFEPERPVAGMRAVAHIRRAIHDFDPDLVHCTLLEASIWGRLAAKRSRRRTIVSLVNTPYDAAAVRSSSVPGYKRAVVRAADTVLNRFATDAFHAISDAVAASAIRHAHVSPDRVSVVRRGADRAALGEPGSARRAEARRALGVGPTDTVLLAVGREEHQKGHVHAVEALAAVRDEVPGAVLVIAGRAGKASEDLSREIRERGLDACVTRLGVRDDVPDLLAAADVFVFPSLFEGLGVSVIEAMAMEVPIVASDVPALRELLDDGACGVLVPPGDAAAVAAAVLGLLRDAEAAAAMASAARQRFDGELSLDHAVAGMEALWDEAARG